MDEEDQQQQQQVVDDPYGFIVEQCIIPSAEENHLRSMPLFSPKIQQPQPSPRPVASTVKHENTDEIEIIIPSLEKETDKEEEEATANMEVDELQRVTKKPTISVQNEAFLQESPPPPMKTRDELVAADDGTPSQVIEELQKTTEEEEPPSAFLQKPPLDLEQNEVLAQSQTPTIQTGQTHFVPARFQPADVGVGPSSSSSSNPRNPKGGGGDNTTIDILDVLRNKGFNIPRPRWWRPEGYNVKD